MRRSGLCALFGAVGAALLAGACGREEDDPVPPPVPPELAVAELRPLGGPTAEVGDACVEIGADPDGTLVLALDNARTTAIGDWLLRPPGTCGSVAACGFLRAVAAIEGAAEQVEILSVTSAIPLPLAQLLDDETVGAAGGGGISVDVTVSLLHDDGFPVRTADGERVETAFTVVLARAGSCDGGPDDGGGGAPSQDGGAGGATDQPAAGGAAGAAGAAR